MDVNITDKQNQVLVVCPNPSIDIYAWVNNFQQGVPNRIKKEERYPGGKGLHVAMALAELGIEVTVAGFWGGEAGQWIQNSCNRYYPSIRFIGPYLTDWSRSCYTFKSEGDFDDTEILGPGPEVSEIEFDQLLTSINEELPSTELIALCGSWPKGSPEDGYRQIIELGHQQDIRSFLDCTGIQLQHALNVKPYGLHLNRKEITDFFGTSDFEETKQKVFDYCEVAAITDGSKGLHYLTRSGAYHSLAKIERVISTIGSGDCLLAGIIAGHIQHLDDQKTAALGASCGAANCLRPELGMLHKEDVQQLFAEIS